MATPTSIKNEMHTASCADLITLKDEADDMVIANPVLLNYFIQHVYREYNRRRYYNCGGTFMIEPYDAGFRPTLYVPDEGEFFMLMEDGSFVLQENDTDKILLD